MTEYNQINVEHKTPKGVVGVFKNNTGEFIEGLQMDEGMGGLTKHSKESLENEKKIMLEILSDKDPRNDVILAVYENKIIGYITMVKSNFNEQWAKLKDDSVVELGFIEVSRNWRNLGIATRMLEATFKDGRYENNIAYSTEYSWHWDMEYNKLNKSEYHDMLLKIFKKAGFEQYDTDDPDINVDWANMLTVRIGGDVDIERNRKFILSLRKDSWKYGL
ncbi:MAG: GNAT family N-acetyltransferase [Candidatus Altiarchaeota archaeon]|nr:GNAT family N-acetyltransferase [Candidatus Altiarchaeota archaeon]